MATTSNTTTAPKEHSSAVEGRALRVIKLPFEGFYCSRYSGALDLIEEREAEHFAGQYGDEGTEADYPPEVRLSQDEIAEVLTDVTDYSAMHRAAAHAYVDAFAHEVGDMLDMDLGLKFESMTSPRAYNFETDRVFAHIPDDVVTALFQRSAADDHLSLRSVIKERFTSRSGFISFYDNELSKWLEKPLADWDHNELETLLLACIKLVVSRDEDWDQVVLERVLDGDGLYSEWSGAVDWTRFKERCAELRADKRAEFEEAHPDETVAVEPRCPLTLDLFRDYRPHGEV